ncbi:XRE family transcriptional regulator [Longimycelium tulufanense]|uniref:XRE family transcriptional regulator n=1 Tax=Longimycelium tulufanense TaxID=907463 RepID=A0A8J3C731_9PSEU|nr:hypothetical protein [Longimycelium tulufanense]GGM46095.1 XRE family transcriptional regulator [Longimycelium tulufanense]
MDPERGGQHTGCGLAAKITRMIETRYPDHRTRPGFAKLATEIREHTGKPMSATYLWELATGRKRNLTQETLGTLAAFFDVPAEYLLDDGVRSRADAEANLTVALRNRKVRSIALRADGLSDHTLDALLAMVDEARRIERLAPVEERSDDAAGPGDR